MADERLETIGQALRGVLGDPAWFKRTAVGVAVTLIPYLGMVWVLGYELTYLRAVAAGRGARLPEWKPAEPQLRTGLYAFVAGMVYSLPLSVLISVGLVVAVALGIMGTAATEDITWMIVIVLASFGFFTLLGAVWGAVLWPVYVHVTLHDTIAAGFDFRQIIARVRRAGRAYWVTLGRAVALSVVSSALTLLVMIGSMGLATLIGVRLLSEEMLLLMSSLLITPITLVAAALVGFVTIPIAYAVHRLWAGYAMVAYDLEDPSEAPALAAVSVPAPSATGA